MSSFIHDILSDINPKVDELISMLLLNGSIIYKNSQKLTLEGSLLRGIITGISFTITIIIIKQSYYQIAKFYVKKSPKTQSKHMSNTTSDDTNTTQIQQDVKPKKNIKTKNIIEICVCDIESIENCRDGGCDSIEICSDRHVGGITPSIGLVEHAIQLLKSTDIEIHVLIRPRPGNFTYTYNEFDVILRDIIAYKKLGVDGIVVGILHADNTVDSARLEVIRALTKGIKLTFHRAYDICTNHIQGLETIIEVGCDRLLTSGRASCAGSTEGINTLLEISEYTKDRLQIIAAGGVHKGKIIY